MGSKPLVCDTISVPPQQYRHGAGRRDVYHEGTTGGPWLFGFETDRQLDHACAVCGEEALLNPAMFSETTTQTDAERMPKNQLRNGWLLWHLRGKWVKADESRCHSRMVQQICVLGILGQFDDDSPGKRHAIKRLPPCQNIIPNMGENFDADLNEVKDEVENEATDACDDDR